MGIADDPTGHLTPDQRGLFFRFLVLIRDNYKKADKAAYFLERRAGIVNTCAIFNLRDVLSHLSTLLDPDTPSDRRADQLANAEEHLRRAILEPYEIGLGAMTEKFSKTYEIYRETLLPMRDATEGFASAPNRTQVEARLAEINDLAEKAKQAKGRNLWDRQWEDGVAALTDAYDKLSLLHMEIDEWVLRHGQHRSSRRQIYLGRWGIAATIIALVLGGIITWAFTGR